MNVFQEFAIDDVIRYGIAGVILFTTLLSIIFIIWGGFLMIISGGNEEKIKPAINHIRNAIIGVGFIFVVIFVSPVIMNLLGMNYADYAKPSSIFGTITEIFDNLFGNNATNGLMLPSDNKLPVDFSSDF